MSPPVNELGISREQDECLKHCAMEAQVSSFSNSSELKIILSYFFVSREPVLSAVNWANESVVAAWVNRVQNRARITRCSINEGVCDVVSLTRTLCNGLKRRIFKLL